MVSVPLVPDRWQTSGDGQPCRKGWIACWSWLEAAITELAEDLLTSGPSCWFHLASGPYRKYASQVRPRQLVTCSENQHPITFSWSQK